jgi:hypothetical protein
MGLLTATVILGAAAGAIGVLGHRSLAPLIGDAPRAWVSVIAVLLLAVAAGFWMSQWIPESLLGRAPGLLILATGVTAALVAPLAWFVAPVVAIDESWMGCILAALVTLADVGLGIGLSVGATILAVTRGDPDPARSAGAVLAAAILGGGAGLLTTWMVLVRVMATSHGLWVIAGLLLLTGMWRVASK